MIVPLMSACFMKSLTSTLCVALCFISSEPYRAVFPSAVWNNCPEKSHGTCGAKVWPPENGADKNSVQIIKCFMPELDTKSRARGIMLLWHDHRRAMSFFTAINASFA